jgi:signal transduction histidine kinase
LQSALVVHLLTRPDLHSFEYFAMLFAPLSMQLVPRLTLRLSAGWLGLFAVSMMASFLRTYAVGEAIGFTLIFSAVNVLMGFYALDVYRAGQARAHNQALASQLDQANRALEETSAHLEQLATERERHRLARELHDSVTQTVFSMTLATQSALIMLERGPDQAGAQLRQLSHLAQDALSQMQQLIAELRPESIAVDGLASALRRHVEARRLPDGLCVTIEVEGTHPLRSEEEQCLYAIAREALNNIVKHARASHAAVRLHLSDPPEMEVVDDGEGFDAATELAATGIGVTGMRERAAEIGWDLRLTSSPGQGTRVRVTKRPHETRQP